jgi:hypothetical protein
MAPGVDFIITISGDFRENFGENISENIGVFLLKSYESIFAQISGVLNIKPPFFRNLFWRKIFSKS